MSTPLNLPLTLFILSNLVVEQLVPLNFQIFRRIMQHSMKFFELIFFVYKNVEIRG